MIAKPKNNRPLRRLESKWDKGLPFSRQDRELAWEQMISAGRIAKKPKKSLSKADKLILSRQKKAQALEKMLTDAWKKNRH